MPETPFRNRTIQPVMIAVDRSPGDNYLGRTLDNLERSIGCELDSLHVSDSFSSSYVSSLALRRKGCTYIEHEPGVVANLNIAEALEYGANTGAEFVLFLEDDIDFIGDFYNSVSRWLDDHVSSLPIIYPLGANYGEVRQGYNRGETYWNYPVPKFYGTQAFLVRSRDVASCCEYIRSHCYDLHEDGTGYDHLIRDWMLGNGITTIPTPCPSFVQHIGTSSIIKRRGSIHTFPSYPGHDYIYRGVDILNAKDTICVVTPARNARAHLDLYFEQLDDLRDELGGDYRMRLIVAEGDSEDGTREALQEYANRYHLDYTLVDTTHGGKYYRSVEDPDRLRTMSNVMSKALSHVRDDDDIVVWIMVDVRYDASDMAQHIERARGGSISDNGAYSHRFILAPLALSNDGSYFWDTWAFRKDGRRFNLHEPYCEFDEVGLTEIDSAGTCLIMSSDVARGKELYPISNEAVEFCDNAREIGVRVYTCPRWCVYHNYNASKRALVLGSYGSTSGFSRCTANLLPELSSKGYEIDVIAVDWPSQRPHNLPWNIWGAVQHHSDSPRGAHQLYRMLVSNKYDLCIVLMDAFDAPAYSKAVKDAREESIDRGNGADLVVAWCAVDSHNQLVAPALNVFDHVIVWTEFAKDELVKHGCDTPIDVVPLGVDTRVFSIGDDDSKRDARENLLVSRGDDLDESIHSAFIVGFVGRNQPRKRPDLAIAAFAEFSKRCGRDEDIYLVMHCQPGNGPLGCDIEGVSRYCSKYHHLPKGSVINYTSLLDDVSMGMFYRMLDVLVVTSTAEGFCLPVLESLACGTPVIAPDFGPIAEWARGEVLLAKTMSDAVVSPTNTAPYTMGRIVDIGDIVDCMMVIKHGHYGSDARASQGRDLALSLDSRVVYPRLVGRLCELVDKRVMELRVGDDATDDDRETIPVEVVA